MEYPKFIVSNLKEESISIQRVKKDNQKLQQQNHMLEWTINMVVQYCEKMPPLRKNLPHCDLSRSMGNSSENQKVHFTAISPIKIIKLDRYAKVSGKTLK